MTRKRKARPKLLISLSTIKFSICEEIREGPNTDAYKINRRDKQKR